MYLFRSLPARGSFAARALGTLAVAAAATGGIVASAGPVHAQGIPSYTYTTLDNSNDLTFNQLLGINDSGVIAGYFGSGMAMHPNKGYGLLPKYGQDGYRVENFPGSNQTQVTGLNNRSTQVGFQSPPTPAPTPTTAGTRSTTGTASPRSTCHCPLASRRPARR